MIKMYNIYPWYKDRDAVELMDEMIDAEDVYAVILYNDEVHTFEGHHVFYLPVLRIRFILLWIRILDSVS